MPLNEMVKDIFTNTAGGVVSWVVIGVLVFLGWTVPRLIVSRVSARKKRSADECAANMSLLCDDLDRIARNREQEKCRKAVKIIRNAGFETPSAKGYEDVAYIERVVRDIREKRFAKPASKAECVKALRDKLRPYTAELRGDKTKARVFINTCGEQIKEGYEVPLAGEVFSDLEKELISRVKERVGSWGAAECGIRKWFEVGCRVIIIGGMRIEFARELLLRIHEVLRSPLLVSVYRKSAYEDMITSLEKLADESGGSIQVGAVDDAGDARSGYDIMISAHYWQHRQFADLMNSRFHLTAKNGLLIWLSASSRGAGGGDIEYVCEGFPPLEPNPVTNGSSDGQPDGAGSANPYGIAIPYTRMDAYDPEKAWVKYELLDDVVWGGRFFYEHHFPRSFTADRQAVNEDFDGVTTEFLNWYFSDCEGISEVAATKVDGLEASDSACSRFGDVQYVVCSVSVKRKNALDSFKQYMIAVVSKSDDDGRRIVTLHPCVRAMVGTPSLSEGFLKAYLEDERLSDQHSAEDRTFVPCDGNASAFRVISRICCPVAKHYVFVMAKSDDAAGHNQGRRYLYVACVPSRTFLTSDSYEAARQMLVDYDARIEDFHSGNPAARFSPFRLDSVTILLPYSGIKEILKESYSIHVEDDSVFFHKCYGRLDQSGLRVVQGKGVGEIETKALQEDIANIDKDRAFNRIEIGKRLKLLGCLNVHDVLLFGVKKESGSK